MMSSKKERFFMELDEAVKAELQLAEEFLKDSELLSGKDSLRSASSRLYYSVFHASRAILYKYGFNPKTHRGAITLFGKEIVGKGVVKEEYAKLLSKTFSLREQADYQPMRSISKNEFEALLREAKKFLSETKELLK